MWMSDARLRTPWVRTWLTTLTTGAFSSAWNDVASSSPPIDAFDSSNACTISWWSASASYDWSSSRSISLRGPIIRPML